MDIIRDLWNGIIEYGYRTRQGKLDGLERWNNIKKTIPNIKIEWTNKSKKIFDDLKAFGVDSSENAEEAGLEKNEWDRNHFLIQHGRIIKNNPDGNLIRLFQIAYNAGQFRAENEKTQYSADIRDYYVRNELNKLETYLDNEINIESDMTELTETMVTG
jgi:hypothetical protein